MAFRFDAKADSSDDDDGVLDISNWKNGTAANRVQQRKNAPVAPVAPMDLAKDDDDDEDELNYTPNLAAFPSHLSRQSSSSPGSPPASSFRAINERLQDQDERSEYDLDSIDSDTMQLPTNDDEEEDEDKEDMNDRSQPGSRRGLVVKISLNEVDREDFEDFTGLSMTVRRIVKERPPKNDGTRIYRIQFDDSRADEIPLDGLLRLDNGKRALEAFSPTAEPDEEDSRPPTRPKRGPQRPTMSSRRPGARRSQAGMVSTIDNIEDSDVEISNDEHVTITRTTRGQKRKQDHTQYEDMGDDDLDDDEDVQDESEDELAQPTTRGVARRGRGRGRGRGARNVARPSRRLRGNHPALGHGFIEDEDDEETDDGNLLRSDLPGARKRRRKSLASTMRVSERATRHKGDMVEVAEDDIYRSDSEREPAPAKPKVVLIRETFKQLPRNNDFRMRHHQWCDTCGQDHNYAPLIHCQGCSLSYHKTCLGNRTNREHLVTKIADDDFVLQCRRCVNQAQKKDPSAPDLGKCQECFQQGHSCYPFRPRKSAAQEQKEREENGGVDPDYEVNDELINNPENVLFRCTGCSRAFHFEHLPSLTDIMEMGDADAEQRFREYSREWKCKECVDMPAKVSGLIAWKPVDEDAYDAEDAGGFDGLNEQDKAYLVKWEGMSYFRARWMPGPWVWGITAHTMRKAFAKREDAQHPKMRTEDAIPEDYLRTDIVLDIKYTSIVDINTEEVDKARIGEVRTALIKYKGLSYEDAVWEAPPSAEDGERWSDFVVAYNDWVAGRYVRPLKPATLKTKLEKLRTQEFKDLEKTEQPANMNGGGKLMDYQVEGLNWLCYKWFKQSNAILADEMGLGKTIQIIGFLATLVQDHSCFPFLIVVPNSTCPNWRREIKRWAPNLRVVAYYGSRESRELANRYELHPNGSKDLRCHVVVTSYDAAADENCRKFFKGVSWQGLIVDEGQRLKNDKNLLYAALGALKVPFKILLTGTPLQNNQRELFNLLHFLDDSMDPAELEKEFEDLDQEKINKLHDMIRPFFLRRTKAQVLTFLPPMAQIIVPVSMSIVQKKLYRSILAKNADLMKAIFSTEAKTLRQGERASLSNILMQLRKCLCHPFVYSKGIEDRNVDIAASHRNLVDASSKLKLLELLLPKLRERGHRVLIFSQFLEMLDVVEDFLDGMQLRFQRLDGTINAMTKQKRIDEFNAPDSSLFAFLVSTRAGGVGINLASADTVIILDPDFNPHQDIQALSRAHRIGQQKKVLCFQLVTRSSAEERIMQIGRKKLALDHVLIQEMDADDAEQVDLVSILRHGATELFEDNGELDTNYDGPSVDRLLDRSHMEDTEAGADKSAETQFSLARVWANDHGALEDANLPQAVLDDPAPNPGVWEHILKERERVAAEEAAAKAEAFGRGRRARANNVDYTGEKAPDGADLDNITPIKRRKKRKIDDDESDTDFQAEESDVDVDDADNGEMVENGEVPDLLPGAKSNAGQKKAEAQTFRRAQVPRPHDPPPLTNPQPPQIESKENGTQLMVNCRACSTPHFVGSCPLKIAGAEYCNLCGIAHYGHARVCPHIQSETQVRAMIEALKHSNEPEHLIKEAHRYLRGLKGSLVQLKKQKEAKEIAARQEALYAAQAHQNTFMTGPQQPWNGW